MVSQSKRAALLVGLLLVAAVTVCDGQSVGSGAPVRIGVIGDFTGPVAPFSTASFRGVSVAVDEINAAGGVNGHKIELKQYDEQNSPAEGVNVAKRVLDEDVAVIVASGSSPMLAMGPVLNSAGVPFIVTISSNPKVTSSGWKWVNRIHITDSQQSQTLVEYAVKTRRFDRIAILYDTSDLGTGGFQLTSQWMQTYNLKPVLADGWNQTATDFSSVVLKLKQANAQAVVIYGTVEGAVRIIKQMKSTGLHNVQILANNVLASGQFFTLAGDAANGVVVTRAIVDAKSPGVSQFQQAYKKKWNLDPDIFASQSYDAMKILAEAMRKAGTSPESREAIQKAIRGISYTGVVGPVKFDGQGQAQRKIYLAQATSGDWKVIQ